MGDAHRDGLTRRPVATSAAPGQVATNGGNAAAIFGPRRAAPTSTRSRTGSETLPSRVGHARLRHPPPGCRASSCSSSMSLLVFVGVYAIGNPIDILINPQADQIDRERAIAALGLDKPLPGSSTSPSSSRPRRRPRQVVRVQRAGAAADPAAHAGDARARVRGDADRDRARHPARLWAGLRPHSFVGRRRSWPGSILGFWLPTFWVGLMLIMVFSVQLGWLPPNGRGRDRDACSDPGELPHARRPGAPIMPALNLALFKLSLLIRLTRAGTREALLQDYVKFARAKGCRTRA